MKLLLDACVWGKACDELRSAGHDVSYVGDWREDPGDEEVLRRAEAEGRVLVTLDKDFGALAVLAGQSHAGIIRLVDITARKQAGACVRALGHYGSELAAGAIVTAEPGRLRLRSFIPPAASPQ